MYDQIEQLTAPRYFSGGLPSRGRKNAGLTLPESLPYAPPMHGNRRTLLAFAGLLLASLPLACGSRFRPVQTHDVAGTADPNATYAVVLEALKSYAYTVIDQDAAAHSVRVRSHIDQHDPGKVSLIIVQVDGAAVHVSASGYLVHPDGTIHQRLNGELAALQKLIGSKLAASAAPPAAGVGTPAALPGTPPGALPVAWSEPAYDPSVWGHGNFTCLPVKLAAQDQAQLTLKLSNGENADVLLSLAYAPELCRSPGECKLPGGCPALGIGDPDHVTRLAARLSKNEVGAQATLLLRGQPVAVIDLAKHGSIAQAMSEIKH